MIEKDICISEEERKEHDKQITRQNVNTLGDERKEYDLLIARQSVAIPQFGNERVYSGIDFHR